MEKCLFKLLIIFTATTLLSYILWLLPNLGGESQLVNAKIRSVSYSPFRRGQSPETGVFPSSPEMEADIGLLSDYVSNIRIYSGSSALGGIPQLAKKYGLTVWLGAWLDSNQETNRLEIDALIELANRYPQTVTRVIVGNENLHRLDITVKQLLEYLAQVKDAVKQPVTYAEGWENWLNHPEVVDAVDIITLHVLPYWEQNPKPVDKVAQHIESILARVSRQYPGKPLAIGEIGWPSFGRSRKAAVPGVHAQLQLITDVHSLAEKNQLDYNIIEAFDQPWKVVSEGTVGAYWGLFSAERKPKYQRGSQVDRYPKWRQWFVLATGLALILVLIIWLIGGCRSSRGQIQVVVMSHVLMSLLILSGLYLDYVQMPQTSKISWVVILVQGYFIWLLLTGSLRGSSDIKCTSTIQQTLSVATLRHIAAPKTRPAMISVLYYLFTYLGVVTAWGMVLQPRYRDFPTVLFLVPVIGVWLSGLFKSVSPSCCLRAVIGVLRMDLSNESSSLRQRILLFREEAFVAGCLCLTAVLVVVGEGVENLEAVAYALVLLALASPYLGMLMLVKK